MKGKLPDHDSRERAVLNGAALLCVTMAARSQP